MYRPYRRCINVACFYKQFRGSRVNSSPPPPPPNAAYMRQWIWSALIQIMACYLHGAKPLYEPKLAYCQLEPKEHISMTCCLKFKYLHSLKCVWTCRMSNGGHFVHGRWVNMIYTAAGQMGMMDDCAGHGNIGKHGWRLIAAIVAICHLWSTGPMNIRDTNMVRV